MKTNEKISNITSENLPYAFISEAAGNERILQIATYAMCERAELMLQDGIVRYMSDDLQMIYWLCVQMHNVLDSQRILYYRRTGKKMSSELTSYQSTFDKLFIEVADKLHEFHIDRSRVLPVIMAAKVFTDFYSEHQEEIILIK